MSNRNMSIKQQWINYIYSLQDNICKTLELEDGKATFQEDKWLRPEGGGGRTRVIANGNVFEKGGVNVSAVEGVVTDAMRNQLKLSHDFNNNELHWFACGLSLVLHPINPFVPTVHCNYRMFELYDSASDDGHEGAVIDRWFGGGTDLTPYYLIDEDAIHFHKTYKDVCDKFDSTFYPTFKKQCDDYFVNYHRNNERRGIGGIFYDYQRPSENKDVDFWVSFGQGCGNAFTEAYIPIVAKRKNSLFTEENKHWQEIRRGRYTEFNLVHDRGTLFGLKTNGRIESILMSLPPTVRFEYNHQPVEGSEEDKLLQACLNPKEWVGM